MGLSPIGPDQTPAVTVPRDDVHHLEDGHAFGRGRKATDISVSKEDQTEELPPIDMRSEQQEALIRAFKALSTTLNHNSLSQIKKKIEQATPVPSPERVLIEALRIFRAVNDDMLFTPLSKKEDVPPEKRALENSCNLVEQLDQVIAQIFVCHQNIDTDYVIPEGLHQAGSSLLYLAAKADSTSLVREMLKRKPSANINTRPANDPLSSPLGEAYTNRNYDLVLEMLNLGQVGDLTVQVDDGSMLEQSLLDDVILDEAGRVKHIHIADKTLRVSLKILEQITQTQGVLLFETSVLRHGQPIPLCTLFNHVPKSTEEYEAIVKYHTVSCLAKYFVLLEMQRATESRCLLTFNNMRCIDIPITEASIAADILRILPKDKELDILLCGKIAKTINDLGRIFQEAAKQTNWTNNRDIIRIIALLILRESDPDLTHLPDKILMSTLDAFQKEAAIDVIACRVLQKWRPVDKTVKKAYSDALLQPTIRREIRKAIKDAIAEKIAGPLRLSTRERVIEALSSVQTQDHCTLEELSTALKEKLDVPRFTEQASLS